jgi:hypothetical protein
MEAERWKLKCWASGIGGDVCHAAPIPNPFMLRAIEPINTRDSLDLRNLVPTDESGLLRKAFAFLNQHFEVLELKPEIARGDFKWLLS